MSVPQTGTDNMSAGAKKSISVGLWNVAWARGGTQRGDHFAAQLASEDIVCLTEAHTDVLSSEGHQITSAPDYGYRSESSRRKVLLWSKHQWREIDSLGSMSLPAGRFVSGITRTRCGDIRFVGVCVPWRDAHVSTGRRNRMPWEDHLTFIQHLAPLLTYGEAVPTILLGDFNQRIPRTQQPERVFEAIMAALRPFRIVTAGLQPGFPAPSIDHLAISGPLAASRVDFLSNEDSQGRRLSDHFGLRILLG